LVSDVFSEYFPCSIVHIQRCRNFWVAKVLLSHGGSELWIADSFKPEWSLSDKKPSKPSLVLSRRMITYLQRHVFKLENISTNRPIIENVYRDCNNPRMCVLEMISTGWSLYRQQSVWPRISSFDPWRVKFFCVPVSINHWSRDYLHALCFCRWIQFDGQYSKSEG